MRLGCLLLLLAAAAPALGGKDYYRMLGVSRSATAKELKKAHRRLALKYHPDKHPPDKQQRATDKLSEINNAYETLMDPEKRRIYDQMGEEGLKHGGAPPPNEGGPGGFHGGGFPGGPGGPGGGGFRFHFGGPGNGPHGHPGGGGGGGFGNMFGDMFGNMFGSGGPGGGPGGPRHGGGHPHQRSPPQDRPLFGRDSSIVTLGPRTFAAKVGRRSRKNKIWAVWFCVRNNPRCISGSRLLDK